jgi:hypothetical protein
MLPLIKNIIKEITGMLMPIIGLLQTHKKQALLIHCQGILRIQLETTNRRRNVILEIYIIQIPKIGIIQILEIGDQNLWKESQNLGMENLGKKDQNQEKGQNQEKEGTIWERVTMFYF